MAMKKNGSIITVSLSILFFFMILGLTVHLTNQGSIGFPFDYTNKIDLKPDDVLDILRNNSRKLSDKALLRFLANEMVKMKEGMEVNAVQLHTQMQSVTQDLTNIKDEYQLEKVTEEGLLKQNNELITKYDLSVKELSSKTSEIGVQPAQRKRFRKHLLLADDPETWRQRSFTHHGTFGFIKFSSYRMDPSKFATVGLAGLSMHQSRYLSTCTWNGIGGETIDGKLKILFVEEHHSFRYEIVVIQCHLSKDTPSSGGYLTGVIDDEEILLFREEKRKPLEAKEPFESQLTFCSAPLYGNLDAKNVWEWFEYNRVILGADKFILYDIDGIDSNLMNRLAPYVDSAMIEITDFRQAVAYHAWYFSQGLAINDCIYRTRFSSKWIFMADFDEYIQVLPPNTLNGILSKYKNEAWLTHGVLWWSTDKCKKEKTNSMFAAERTCFHWPHVYCQNQTDNPEYCLNAAGHRKYFINPRKVQTAQTHQIMEPFDGGVHLSVLTEMRHNHFRGLAEAGQTCKEFVEPGKNIDWWKRDDQVMETLFDAVRACPFGDKTCVTQIGDEVKDDNDGAEK